MATNKYASSQYHALNRCLSNYGRKLSFEDLLNTFNETICDYIGIEEGINNSWEGEEALKLVLKTYKKK